MPFYKNILGSWKKTSASSGSEDPSSSAPRGSRPLTQRRSDNTILQSVPPDQDRVNPLGEQLARSDTVSYSDLSVDPFEDAQIANFSNHISSLSLSENASSSANKLLDTPTVSHSPEMSANLNTGPDTLDNNHKGKNSTELSMDFGQNALFEKHDSFYPTLPPLKSSRESIASRQDTISTYQSSLFSGFSNARTIESATTAGSSLSYSKSGYNPSKIFPVAEDTESVSSLVSHVPGKPMKVIQPSDYIVEESTSAPKSGRSRSNLASSQQRQRHIPTFSSGMAPHRSMPTFSYEEKESAILFEATTGSPSIASTSPTSVKSMSGKAASIYSGSSYMSSNNTAHSLQYQQKQSKQSKHQQAQQPQKQLQSAQPLVSLPEALDTLSQELSSINNQFNSGTVDIAVAGPSVTYALKDFLQMPCLDNINSDTVSVNKYPSLANTIKIVLHFHDNLLSHHCHSRTRGQMLRLFCLLGTRLKLLSVTSNCALAYPRNFAFGSVAEFDSQAVVLSIMDSIASAESSAITDQEGSFIAPVLRGLGPQFAVLTITFGFPEPSQDHYDVVTSLTKLMPDIHLYCQKNSISVCANGVSNSSRAYFKPPFREPLDDKCPPISLSLSVQNAQTTSGTLGGYIYPKINPRKKELADHARFTYAMTCAHVCMTSRPRDSSENNYSAISVPSSVLINMFKRALQGEVKKYPPTSEVYRAYNGAVKGLDEKYPMPDNEGKYNPSCNQPKDTFGQVVWGERTVINGSISDIAIIRCSPNITCRNYLGDDICFSEYDPALMFENLHVKHIEQKIISGMHVFKYGSTSKYTAGIFNGPKIVYWADGKIQSSEFIVRSTSSPMFATGGDSGSWILHKREYNSTLPVPGNISVQSTGPGLSVLGMLHSYDGEHKEFGLFTPMTQILDRLAEITGNKWGIVGVADNQDDDVFVGGSESSGNEADEQADDNGNSSE